MSNPNDPLSQLSGAARWQPFSSVELLILLDALGDMPSSSTAATDMWEQIEDELKRRRAIK